MPAEAAPSDTDLDTAAQEDVRALRAQISAAEPDSLRLLLTEARTHYGWQDRPVTDDQLRRIYDIAKMGPTSMNQQPMRLIFIRSAEAKKRLEPLLMEGNRPKTMGAPVTALIGHDMQFYTRLPEVFPANPNAKDMFASNPAMAEANAVRNGTLQGAWFILAARAIGLDTGPMSGFDNAGVDKEFFAGSTVKSNFLCNLGYADETKIFRRLPRLAFDDVAKII
ncbi:MAG: malonic semialdehyde reductase [Pseudomonadota bacterium]